MNCIQENSDNKKKTPRDIIKRDRIKGDSGNKMRTKMNCIQENSDNKKRYYKKRSYKRR